MKIMDRKSYGSIPHLLGSKMGIGDKRITQGQHDYICNKKRKNDFIVIQEKLDGSCVAVFKKEGVIYPLTRAGYAANTSPYEQHHLFYKWCHKNEDRFQSLLENEERVVGEWLLQAHGTHISLWHEPFVAFDIMTKTERLPYGEFLKRISLSFMTPHLLRYGSTMHEEEILGYLENSTSFHGADKIEGIVCRLETNGKVNYLEKYVRHDYEAGKFMKEEIYNENWEKYITR